MKNIHLIFALFKELFQISPFQVSRIIFGSFLLGLVEIFALGSLLPIIKTVTQDEAGDSMILDVISGVFLILGLKEGLVEYILFFLAISLATSIFYMLIAYDRAKFTQMRELQIKRGLIEKVLGADWIHLGKIAHGRIANGLTRESDMWKVMTDTLLSCVTNVIYVFSFLAALFFIDTTLALISIGVFSSTYLIIGPILGYSKKIGRRFTKESTVYSQSIFNLCRSLKIIKAMSLEGVLRRYMDASIKNVSKAYFLNNGMIGAFRVRFFEFLGMLSLCSLIYFSVEVSHTSQSSTLLMLSILVKMTPVASVAFNQLALILNQYPSIQFVRQLEDDCPPSLKKGDVELEELHQISLEKVRFRYAEKELIRNVSYVFEKGKFYLLLGESGAGKTTLLDLIAGLLDPDDGMVSVNKRSLKSYSRASLSQKIGYLSQASFIIQGSLRENLVWGLKKDVGEDELLRVIKMACLDEFVNENGLDYAVSESGQNLSGGQKQRLAIARLFLGDYEFLLLDEPTSALDAGTEKIIMGHLNKMHGKVGVICVTHREKIFDEVDGIIHSSELRS